MSIGWKIPNHVLSVENLCLNLLLTDNIIDTNIDEQNNTSDVVDVNISGLCRPSRSSSDCCNIEVSSCEETLFSGSLSTNMLELLGRWGVSEVVAIESFIFILYVYIFLTK